MAVQSVKVLGRRGIATVWVIAGAAAVLVVAVAAVAMFSGRGGASQPDALSEIASAVKMNFDVTATANGELEARRQIEIRNQLEQSTTITEIIKEGTFVKAGDVLVRLNSEAIETQIREEQLRVETARAELTTADNAYQIQVSDNESALRKARLDVDVKELELKQWLDGEVNSKRQANQLALERADRELTRLKDKFDRAVELEKQGFLSKDELRRDEVAYLEAQAALQTARLNQQVYENFEYPKDRKVRESAVEEARAELDRTAKRNASQLETRAADLRNKREQLSIREDRWNKLKEQLSLATLRAPIDGLVVYDTSLNRDRRGQSEAPLDVGRQVSRNQRLIVLPDTSEMVAAVRIHESLTGRVRPGQPVSVRIDAVGPRPISGAVESIGVIAESGNWFDPNLREYTVKIRLENAEGVTLKPSMRCEAEIFVDRVENALTVPIQSVFSEGLVRYVLVPAGSRFDKRPVRVGRRSDRFAEILRGVDEGTRVLLREPLPGEVADEKWSKDELAAVGLSLMGDGRIVPIGGGPGAAGAAAPGGGNGAPAGARPPGAGATQGNGNGGPGAAHGNGAPPGGDSGAPAKGKGRDRGNRPGEGKGKSPDPADGSAPASPAPAPGK